MAWSTVGQFVAKDPWVPRSGEAALEVAMLTLFGSIAVSIMLLSYWLEPRSKWFVLVFVGASAATSVYSGLAEVYPIMGIEALWAVIALERFRKRHNKGTLSGRGSSAGNP